MKHEPGDIARSGRFRGQLLYEGSAIVKINDARGDWTDLTRLVLVLESSIGDLRLSGASDIILSCAVYHDGQCNFEFFPEEMRRIAALGIPFHISCYEEVNPTGQPRCTPQANHSRLKPLVPTRGLDC